MHCTTSSGLSSSLVREPLLIKLDDDEPLRARNVGQTFANENWNFPSFDGPPISQFRKGF